MDQTFNDEKKEADEILKEKLHKLTDDWLSKKIDNSSYAVSVACYDLLNQLEEKLFGYQQNDRLTAHIRLIISLVSNKHLTPKEEQQVKEKLTKIKRIWNDSEDSEVEKEKAVAGIVDKIEGVLQEIVEVVRG